MLTLAPTIARRRSSSKFWLASRQIRHIGPAPRRRAARLSACPWLRIKKARPTTIASARFGLNLAFSAALLMGWTLLGGLDLLNGWVPQLPKHLPRTTAPGLPACAAHRRFADGGGVLDLLLPTGRPCPAFPRIEQASSCTTVQTYVADPPRACCSARCSACRWRP